MRARAARFIASTSIAVLLIGASVSQAAPGEPGPPGGVPPGQIISGHLSIVHADDFEGDTRHAHDGSIPDHVLPGMQYWLTSDSGEEIFLEFPGYPPSATPGGYYSARGERHGNAFHVAEMREEAAPGGSRGGGGPKPKPTPTPASFLGTRDMIVIPITFKSDPSRTLTPTEPQIRERGFTGARSVKTYFEEGSSTSNTQNPLILRGKNDGATTAPFDKDGLPGDVTSVYAVDGGTTCGDYRTWAANAKTAASADGWDLNGYEHIVYIHPRVTKIDDDGDIVGCWGGLAEVGGDETWMNNNISLGTWAHELGHNLTLYHSRTLICSDGEVFYSVARSGCEYDEYGDPFDTMGSSGYQRHFHARNKAHMSWIPLSNVVTVGEAGQYTIYPVETATLGPQLLQISRGRSENIYLDFRQPSGTFDNYGITDDAVTGPLIRLGPSIASNGNSWLIDTSMYPIFLDSQEDPPDVQVEPEFLDAALQVGEGWVDPVSGTYIETLYVENGTVAVLILKGQTNAAPQVTIDGSSPLILPGAPHQAPNASATDTHKNLGMYRWSWSSSSPCQPDCPTLNGAEGALSGGSDTIAGPIYVPPAAGQYHLTLTVWDTSGAKTITDVTETVGP